MACATPPEVLVGLRPKLMAYALRRARSPEQAEDAVQDALVAALEGLHSYAGTSSLSTWLFGILKHKIVDGLRRGPREELQDMDLDELTHEGPGPEQRCASHKAVTVLGNSLARLPAKASRAFVLREVVGLSTAEVCGILGVTPNHCWVLVHRARQGLRACPDVGRVMA
jgi:RNA polymerase sigma factor (sigma-70 family)